VAKLDFIAMYGIATRLVTIDLQICGKKYKIMQENIDTKLAALFLIIIMIVRLLN
jgi:hypothetical protein